MQEKKIYSTLEKIFSINDFDKYFDQILEIICKEFHFGNGFICNKKDIGEIDWRKKIKFYPSIINTISLFDYQLKNIKDAIISKNDDSHLPDNWSNIFSTTVILPINIPKNIDLYFLLYSHSKEIQISYDTIKTIKLSIENKYISLHDQQESINKSRIDSIRYKQLFNVIRQGSDFKQNYKTLSEKYNFIEKLLDINKSNSFKNDGLRHFSCWKINYSDNNLHVIKTKCHNYIDCQVNNVNTIIDAKQNHHFIYKYTLSVLEKIKNKNFSSIFDLVQNFRLSAISGDLKDKNYYYNNLGLNDNDSVLIIPILPPSGIDIRRINFLTLYIAGNHSLLEDKYYIEAISYKLYESFTLTNYVMRKRLMNNLFGFAKEFSLDNQQNFYKKTVDEICKIISAENCLIYFFDERRIKLNLVNDPVDKLSYTKYKHFNLTQNPFIDYFIEDEMKEQIKRYFNNLNATLTLKKKDDILVINHRYGEEIKSLLVVPLFSEKEKMMEGVLICVNKHSYINTHYLSKAESNFFSIQNSDVLMLATEFIILYKKLTETENRRLKIYQRIEHEIPKQCDIILNNSKLIKEFPENGNPSHYINLLSGLNCSTERIIFLSKCLTTLQLKDEEILSKTKNINLRFFFASITSMLEKECETFGISYYIHYRDESNFENTIHNASELLEPAILNVILNAIHYSNFGSTVLIEIIRRFNFDFVIRITNYGIEIKEDEKNLIFEEEYRGEAAINKTALGSGIGLFLAKRIITAHQGSTIYFTQEKVANSNIFGKKAVLEFIKHFDDEQKSAFFNKKANPNDIWSNEYLSLMLTPEEKDFYYNSYKKDLEKVHAIVKSNFFSKFIENNYWIKFSGHKYKSFSIQYLGKEVFKTVFEIYIKTNKRWKQEEKNV